MEKDKNIEIAAYAIAGIILFFTIAIIVNQFKHEPEDQSDAPPPPPPMGLVFELSSPMDIHFISDDKYEITVEATDFCSATVWWKRIDSDDILGFSKHPEFDKKKHVFVITEFPKNDSIYVGAKLIQKHEANTKTIHTYQAGTFLRTDNFHILETLNVEGHKVRVIATRKNTINIHAGKSATTVTEFIVSANNPTEVSPGVWRHTLTLPEEYSYWSASLINKDKHSIYTGIIKYE